MALTVLVTSGGTGHVQPTVPLARALVGRGHDVLWALPDRSVVQVEQAGLRAVGVTSAPPVHPPQVLELFPELRELPQVQRPERMFAKLFGALLAPPMVSGLTPVAQRLRPDLVVSDAAELAGPLVAAALGVPGVAKGFGPLPAGARTAAAVPAAGGRPVPRRHCHRVRRRRRRDQPVTGRRLAGSGPGGRGPTARRGRLPSGGGEGRPFHRADAVAGRRVRGARAPRLTRAPLAGSGHTCSFRDVGADLVRVEVTALRRRPVPRPRRPRPPRA